MAELLIHIGTHKTGTTVLQKYLHFNRDSLAALGWCYPKTGISNGAEHFGHHDIAWHFSKQKDVDFDALFREIDASGADRILFSSEEFESTKAPEAIRAAFSRYDIRIIVYFRRQDDFLLSSYNQVVKMGLFGKSLRAFQRRLELRNRLDYYAFCEKWASAFGRENILVRVYEKERSIVDAFLETLGIECNECSEPPFVYANKSLDPRLIGAMRALVQLKQAGIDTEMFEHLANVIRNYKPSEDAFYSLMNVKERTAMLEQYRTCNRMLSEQYLDGRGFPAIDSAAGHKKVSDTLILPDLFKHLIRILGRQPTTGVAIPISNDGCRTSPTVQLD